MYSLMRGRHPVHPDRTAEEDRVDVDAVAVVVHVRHGLLGPLQRDRRLLAALARGEEVIRDERVAVRVHCDGRKGRRRALCRPRCCRDGVPPTAMLHLLGRRIRLPREAGVSTPSLSRLLSPSPEDVGVDVARRRREERLAERHVAHVVSEHDLVAAHCAGGKGETLSAACRPAPSAPTHFR